MMVRPRRLLAACFAEQRQWFASRGVAVNRLLSDNGAAYGSHALRGA